MLIHHFITFLIIDPLSAHTHTIRAAKLFISHSSSHNLPHLLHLEWQSHISGISSTISANMCGVFFFVFFWGGANPHTLTLHPPIPHVLCVWTVNPHILCILSYIPYMSFCWLTNAQPLSLHLQSSICLTFGLIIPTFRTPSVLPH